MRLAFGIIFLAIIIAMIICARIARHSGKRIGFAAAGLLAPLILPMAGNGIIIMSSSRTLSLVGCYLYYIGLDFSIAALLHFTFVYCRITNHRKLMRNIAYSLLLVDVVQLFLNPFFHHAFSITEIEVDGFPYFKMIPLFGQQFHRAVDYFLLVGIIVIFTVRLIRAPRLQAERYSVILFALLLVSAWETAYIFSGTPIDRSMIGFGVFGLLIFYFSIYYRPMRLLDRMLSDAASERKDPMYFFDDSNRCIWMNRAGAEFLNLEEHDLTAAGAELNKQFGGTNPDTPEWRYQTETAAGGETRAVELTKQLLVDSKRKMNGYYVYIRDLTEAQREAEQKLYNARHDHLTGLYNRDYLYVRTRELMDENPEETFLVIGAEISDLKVINDLYGNAFGDHALKIAADWLRNNPDLQRGGVFGRLGGDSFGACLPEKHFSLEKMESALSGLTAEEGDTRYRMLIHVGINRITERDSEISVMYDRAVLALEGIKDDYHYHTAWYDSSMRDNVVRNRQISGELADALAEGQIVPWLQPIVSAEGKVLGAEALVRWIHPEEGIRPPLSFIPMFEKNGMIADVDRFIWRKSCEILARWKQEGKDLFISVNISPRDFYLMDVPSELKRLVGEYGLEPSRLRLEITETLMMRDAEEQMEILRSLHADGFCIEMDDFGSGFSSLNLLREMPVDILKIDMVFLRQAGENEKAKKILRQVVTMARELAITSLTEGVETEHQFETLKEMGCELFQGYYFSKPLPEADFERFLSEGEKG